MAIIDTMNLIIRVVSENHAWNRVQIDAGTGEKEWYALDVTHANTSMGGEYEFLSLEQYLITDAQKTAYGYTAMNYAGTAVAETSVNPFALLHYGTGEESEENDLVIVSDAELSDLLTCVLAAREGSTTDFFSFDVFLPHSYSATLNYAKSKVQLQLAAKGFTGSISYSSKELTFDGTSGISLIVLLWK